MILHILYLAKLGNGNAATAKLREHHQLVDAIMEAVESEKRNWDSQGTFELSCVNGTQKLYFQWFNLDEAFVFGYLMSGVVNLPDSAAAKAKSFLKEGIRVTDSMSVDEATDVDLLSAQKDGEACMWLSEELEKRKHLLRVKRYTLLYLSFVTLLRSYWDEAFTVLPRCKLTIAY
jgi:hypothetical protein